MNTELSVHHRIFLRNCSCLTALVIQLCDHASTFQFESKYIWKRSLTPVKFVYLFCRYFGLICQIINVTLLFTKLYEAPVNPLICRHWFTFLISSIAVPGTMIHAIAMLRVYALHQKDFRVGILLTILLATTSGLCMHAWWLSYPHIRYDSICSLEYLPSSMLRLWVIAEESIILALIIIKKNVATRYANIVGRVVRDGGGFFVFMVVTALSLILPSAKAIHASLTTFALIWFLTIVSIMTCRLIKGFFQMDVEVPTDLSSESSRDVEFTSFIDIEEDAI
ncbi:hypothetical protein BDQ17DRAFT_854398 [Cyathus striatus]|nr:hypothetical protein BDQ17DRAFT_854398 [Cyathus striatus]